MNLNFFQLSLCLYKFNRNSKFKRNLNANTHNIRITNADGQGKRCNTSPIAVHRILCRASRRPHRRKARDSAGNQEVNISKLQFTNKRFISKENLQSNFPLSFRGIHPRSLEEHSVSEPSPISRGPYLLRQG